MKAREGQVAVYLIMILVVVFVLALLNVDSFVAVRSKNRLQNAGDAAALAAARRQGSLLNEIGRLNVDHMLAAIDNDEGKCERIVAEQRRLALLGPVEALRFANEAALKNGMEVREEFSQILEEHVNDIRTVYAGGENAEGEPYPEPYPGAWTEYATAIRAVVGEGLATGPDNIEFYDAAGGHMLLNRMFYNAVAGKDWCWFRFNHCENLLKDYRSYRDWGPLPTRRENPLDNSEIFSLHVVSKRCALTDVFDLESVKTLAGRFANREVTDEELLESYVVTNRDQAWFFFDDYAWRQWFDGLRLADDDDGYEFPLVGEVKPEYNVKGCAAVCRCVQDVESMAVETTSSHTWSAAAKPFGTVDDIEGELGDVTALNRFVVPCMTDVRLVSVDSVGGQNLGTADFGWVHHIRHHLPSYLARGPVNAQGCYYCLQLQTWEREYFRQEGVRWLKDYGGTCVRPTGGGGTGHGGTSHGH